MTRSGADLGIVIKDVPMIGMKSDLLKYVKNVNVMLTGLYTLSSS